MSRTGYHNNKFANKEERKHMSGFATPSAPGGGIAFKDHLGALLLIDVLGVERDVKTVHGTTDATSANVNVIDGPGEGESYEDTLIFPKLLHSQTKKHIGEKVLGRLGQGEKKSGQDPPWILNEATAEDIAKAETWVAAHAKPSVTSAEAPF